jgi:hypothetical protein
MSSVNSASINDNTNIEQLNLTQGGKEVKAKTIGQLKKIRQWGIAKFSAGVGLVAIGGTLGAIGALALKALAATVGIAAIANPWGLVAVCGIAIVLGLAGLYLAKKGGTQARGDFQDAASVSNLRRDEISSELGTLNNDLISVLVDKDEEKINKINQKKESLYQELTKIILKDNKDVDELYKAANEETKIDRGQMARTALFSFLSLGGYAVAKAISASRFKEN